MASSSGVAVASFENAQPPQARRRPVRDRAGHSQLDLGADTDRATDLESSPDDRRALAHALQAEMTGPPLPPHRLLVHAHSVVADRQAQLPLLVVDRDDDLARLRVLERVAQRLARDPVRFLRTTGFRSREAPSTSTSIAAAATADRSLLSSAPIAAIPLAARTRIRRRT
jgi:hypothetical protein